MIALVPPPRGEAPRALREARTVEEGPPSPASAGGPDLEAVAEAVGRLGGPRGRPPVATLGFFDGLHRGHQQVIGELVAWAREVDGLPAVITFDRHPQEVLQGRRAPTLTPLPHRLLLLSRLGVELALALPFDRELASWPAEEFLERVLVGALGARRLLLGFDSAFGRGRRGTFEALKPRERELGIELRRGEPLLVQGLRVSSTVVREAALAGDLAGLERLLGRPLSVLGQVVRGDGRGRTLGFPTANLGLSGQPLPPRGVYFAEAEPVDLPARPSGVWEISPRPGRRWPAVVNIGLRPTFAPEGQSPVLEAHLLDFQEDLYGKWLEVHLLARHREERRFAGPRELAEEIRRDIEARRRR